jgi:hypothetical protein
MGVTMTTKKWNRFFMILKCWVGGEGGEPCFSRGASHFDFHTHVIGLCPLAQDVPNTNKNILKIFYNKNILKKKL